MAQGNRNQSEWMAVYRSLRDDIRRGDLPPGAEMPTISALAKSANLTSHGARRVMENLCADGIVHSWQGKGCRVALPKIRLNLNTRQPRFSNTVRAMGFSTVSEVVASKTQGLPRELAPRMSCRAGTKVTRTETLRKVNGRAVALSVDFFLKDRLDGIDVSLRQTGSVSVALSMLGVPYYERDHTSFEVRLPTAHEALLLNIAPQQPVYATMGANIAPDGCLVQVSKGVWRGDCVVYEL
ncbi:MAG: GntR family transcriptional regulator [Pseudomonadota bacterium]